MKKISNILFIIAILLAIFLVFGHIQQTAFSAEIGPVKVAGNGFTELNAGLIILIIVVLTAVVILKLKDK